MEEYKPTLWDRVSSLVYLGGEVSKAVLYLTVAALLIKHLG